MKTRNLYYLVVFCIVIGACKHRSAEKTALNAAANSIQKDSLTAEVNFEGYSVKYKYLKHEVGEEGSGENPALLQVYKNEKLIFTDSFKAEGAICIDTLGYHSISGRKFFFKLNYGIEACDYTQTGKYYFISPESGIHYLKDFYSVCGGDGYSCKNYQHYFPGDSSGITNGFRVIDVLRYNEHDRPDKFDTIDWQFDGDKFNIIKQTHYLNTTAG